MTVRVRWGISQFPGGTTGYDQFKVMRADTEGGSYSEVTVAGTRPAISTIREVYFWDDTTGDTSKWYKVILYDSVGASDGSSSDSFQTYEPGLYASIEEARAGGVAAAPTVTDSTIRKSLKMWSQFLDKVCRQWFEPRELEHKVDGSGARTLWLMLPIIGVDEFYMNADFTNQLSTDWYEVYNNLGDGLRDDRRNPRIGLSDVEGSDTIFTATSRQDIFIRGKKNQQIKGTFGFVELDGQPPALINRAVLKLVVRELTADSSLSPSTGVSGPVTSETTDGHTIRYASTVGGRKIGTIGITGDPEVEAIIIQYRGPKAMAVAS